MILKMMRLDDRYKLAAGQICLVIGILTSRYVRHASEAGVLNEFTAGFLYGLSGVCLGISIVFNIHGIRILRKTKPR